MKAGYDEWVAARAPSLLAFAAAVADDEARAEATVADVLGRLRATWARAGRDDPDLEARRRIVRATARPERAAAVLHVLEGRSDVEVAEVLRCSPAAARRRLRRGLSDLRARHPGEDPASALRERAADGTAGGGLLTLAPPPTRRTPRAPGPWAGAVAMLALVTGTAIAAHVSRAQEGVIHYPKVVAPSSWRFESYAGVELQVPGTWGWGGSPVRTSGFRAPRHLASCGADGAAVQSPEDHAQFVSVDTGFVGRPAVVSEACVPWGSGGSLPRGDAVWFDSPLPVGVRALGPTVAETRSVGSQHVTVFASQPGLRREILGTATVVDVDGNGCPTRAVTRPRPGPRGLVPETLSVCVYSQDTGQATLLYSALLPTREAATYTIAAARHLAPGRPCPTPSGRWVALGLSGAAGTRWDVANLACGRIEVAGGVSAALDPATVAGWAVDGVPAYVAAPRSGSPALRSYLRAPTT